MSGDEERQELNRRGKIQITMRRGTATNIRDTEDEDVEPEMPLTTSKKVAIDGGKSHNVQ